MSTTRVPALDGWRGIAILLVLFDHVQVGVLGHYWRPWAQTGQHGVTLFFVLSGYLITGKLMEGPIDLKRFYIRRLFRLMPVAWIFLAAMLLLGRLLSVRLISGAELQACLLFYRNFLGASIVAGHFWSLSLEEQFYLVWPALLLILGIPRCRWIAISGALACATYRFVFWSMYDRHPLNDQTQVRADAILVGCLLAILLADPSVLHVASYFTRRVAIPALVVFAICLAHFHFLPPLIECVAAAVLLAVPVLHPEWRMTRVLSFRPLCWLGVISYSVYVWQQCFLMAGPGFRIIAWCIVFPATVLASHYWIERPMTRLGHRVATGRSANERIGPPSAGRRRCDRDGECLTAGEPV